VISSAYFCEEAVEEVGKFDFLVQGQGAGAALGSGDGFLEVARDLLGIGHLFDFGAAGVGRGAVIGMVESAMSEDLTGSPAHLFTIGEGDLGLGDLGDFYFVSLIEAMELEPLVSGLDVVFGLSLLFLVFL